MPEIKRICVFCGSSLGARPIYQQTAVYLGKLLAAQGIELVYGGGKVGLMGIVADAVLSAGGRVIGVIPELLVAKEVAHTGLTQQHVVASMHERKALMAGLSDAFIALPGGYGTLDEMCEILTWAQLGLHQKPSGLLNTEGYYDGLLQFFNHIRDEQFLRPEHRSLILEAQEPEQLLALLQAYRPTIVDKILG